MAQVTITINAREFAIACEDGQELRIMQLARILDEKAKLLTQSSGQVNESMLLAMVGLLLADELSELKKGGLNQSSTPPSTTTPSAGSLDNPRLLEIDTSLANKIKSLALEIKSVASQIDLL